MIPGRPDLADLRRDYAHCFACGRDNPVGLGIDGFSIDGDGVVSATFAPRPEHAGLHGVLHGGIVATGIDEILAWTAILAHGLLVVTGTLDLRYRKPAPVQVVYTLRGRVDERRGRRLLLSGSMEVGTEVVAEGSGLYLVHRDLAASAGPGQIG